MLGTRRVWVVVKSVVSHRLLYQPPARLPLTASRFQYLKITLNWVTIAFFVFSFLHCFTQGTIQSFLFSADDTYGALTSEIVAYANISPTVFPQYTGRHGKYSLELCDQVPVVGGEPDPCDPFFTVGQSEPVEVPPRFLPSGSSADKRDVSLVRQLFLDSFDLCSTFLLYSLPAPSVRRTWWVSIQASFPPLSPFSRPHLFGSSMIVTFISSRNQRLMEPRTSSSLQQMEPCRSPSSPSVHTPSCIRRPSKCWSISVHFQSF